MKINAARLKQIILSVFIMAWGIFIFSKVYELTDLYYIFNGLNAIVSAGGALSSLRITASYFWSFITLFCLAVSSFVIGNILLSVLRLRAATFLENTILSAGLGLSVWSYLTFFLGMLGALQVGLFKWLFWIVFALSLWYLARNKKNYQWQFNAIHWTRSYLSLTCLILLAIVLLINIICALAPEIHYDALVYQLALPGFYKLHGRILDVPFNFNSYFPQNMNMLYLLSLLVGNDTVAKLLHLFSGLGSLLIIYIFARKHFSRRAAIAAAAGFYLVPQVALQSWAALNDLGLTFYVLLNLLCLDNWLEDKDNAGKYLYLSAIFSGFALGIKYMSAASVAISLSLILYQYGYRNQQWKRSFAAIGKFAIIVLVMVSPWLLRNFSLTGSPFAPFAVAAQKSPLGCDFKKNIFLDDCAYPRSFNVKEFFITPWLNTLGKSNLDSLAGPLFVFFAPLLIIILLRAKMDRKIGLLLFYFTIYYIMWRSQTSVWRYFLPAMAVFCMIAGYLMYSEKISALNRGLLKILFAGILLNNLAVICMALERMDPVPVVSGRETKESYLGRTHLFYQDPVYPAIEYINSNVSLQSRILFVGDSRGYYCERDYIANTAFDVPAFQKYFTGAKDAGDLARQLRQDGITHILLNEKELARLQQQYKSIDFQPRDIILLKEFWRDHGRPVFYNKGVGLYEIL